jgi:hypothetical protein
MTTAGADDESCDILCRVWLESGSDSGREMEKAYSFLGIFAAEFDAGWEHGR